jgi:two-component system nitrate/nitrite response regulator NarL
MHTASDTINILLLGHPGSERDRLSQRLLLSGFKVRAEPPDKPASMWRTKTREGDHLSIIDGTVADPVGLCRRLVDGGVLGKIAMVRHSFDAALLAEVIRLDNATILQKDVEVRALELYLRLLASGEPVLPSSAYDLIARAGASAGARHKTASPALTPQEARVAEAVASGKCNKLLARELNIAEPTVKAHIKAVLRKLGMSNRTQIAVWAGTRLNSGHSDPRPRRPDAVIHQRATGEGFVAPHSR